MLVCPSVDVNNIQEVNDDVYWKYTDDACEVLPSINVVLAAITTAHTSTVSEIVFLITTPTA